MINIKKLFNLILLGVIGLAITPQLHAATEAPSDLSRQNTFGAHRETVEDIQVKVQGGFIRHTRSWNQGKWYFNRRWENLYEKLKDSTSTAAGNITIYRGASEYDYKGSNIYGHESDPAQIIIKSATGYRWQNRKGDWIEYDENRRAIKYSDRNNNIVTFQYDAQDRMTGVFDVNNKQIYWYEYNLDGKLSLIKDYTNRKVEYKYTSGQLTEVIDVRGNSNKYTYISGAGNDQLASKIDAEGRETAISYTANGLVSGINTAGVTVKSDLSYDKTKGIYTRTWIYSTGKSVTKSYNSAGNFIGKSTNGISSTNIEINGLTRTTIDQAGNRTTKTYDQWENLLSTTYPDGSKISTVYEHSFTLPVKEVNENGVITLREYDDRGNLTKLTEAAGLPEQRIATFTYDAYGNQLSKTMHADAVSVEVTTSATYDLYGNKLTIADGEGHVNKYTYNVLGHMLTRTDSLKNMWVYTYDASGNQLSKINPLDYATYFEFDKVGNLIKVTDALNRITKYEYDTRNNRVAEINALNEKKIYKYNDEDMLVQTTDAANKSTYIAYNVDGLPIENKDGNGNVIKREYLKGAVNGSGLIGKVIYPTYMETMTYNERGRMVKKAIHLNTTKTLVDAYEYDKVGRRTSFIDAGGRKNRFVYDALDRRVEVINSVNEATKYSYDNRNNVLAVTNSKGGATRYEYNRNDSKSAEIKPLGEEIQYNYNATGLLTKEVDSNGHVRVLIYDSAGRNVRIESYISSNDAIPEKIVDYKYDAVNNLLGYSDSITSSSSVYDELNRLLGTIVDFGNFVKSFSYTYDSSGNKASFTGVDGITVAYNYDANDQLASIKIPGAGQLSMMDYKWSRPQVIALPGGASQSYSYDPLMRLTGIELNDPAQNSLMKYSYSLNDSNNIDQKQTEHGLYKYSYDDLNRLIAVESPTISSENYSYDSLGNRLTDGMSASAWEYNLNNQLAKDGSGTGYIYNQNGSVVKVVGSNQARDYIYNASNRLSEVIENNVSVAKYYYDPFGRRLSKQINSQIIYYIYSEEGLIAEINQDGSLIKQYGWKPNGAWGTNPIYLSENNQVYFYQNDHLGAPQKIINSTGSVVWSATFLSFGKAFVQTDGIVNNLRLPGQYFDQETNLNYNYFRYYDPLLGRYLESDPISLEGGVNTYLYALANPVSNSDRLGLKCCSMTTEVDMGCVISANKKFRTCTDFNKVQKIVCEWVCYYVPGLAGKVCGMLCDGGYNLDSQNCRDWLQEDLVKCTKEVCK